jgi:hypothetical protein
MGFEVTLGRGKFRFVMAVGPGVWLRVPLMWEVFVGGGQGFTVDRWRNCRDA